MGPDTAKHSYHVIYSHNHEKVSVPLKSQVFAGQTTHQAQSIVSLFYMARFEAAAASYTITEAWSIEGQPPSDRGMAVHRYKN